MVLGSRVMVVPSETASHRQEASPLTELGRIVAETPRDEAERAAWYEAVQEPLIALARREVRRAMRTNTVPVDAKTLFDDLFGGVLEKIAFALDDVDLSLSDNEIVSYLLNSVRYGVMEARRQLYPLGRRIQARAAEVQAQLGEIAESGGMASPRAVALEVAKAGYRDARPAHGDALLTQGRSAMSTWSAQGDDIEDNAISVMSAEALHLAAAMVDSDDTYSSIAGCLFGGRLRQLSPPQRREMKEVLVSLGAGPDWGDRSLAPRRPLVASAGNQEAGG